MASIATAINPIPQSAPLTQLLSACQLPTSDIISSESLQFFGAYMGKKLIGSIGLEVYAQVALLRSLAIMAEQRGSGLGKTLVRYAEQQAALQGISTLFLLTTTAAPFFTKLGYAVAKRENAPAAIKTTAQFNNLCPASSDFMYKHLRVLMPPNM